MIFVARRLGGRVALAFLGYDMYQNWPDVVIPDILQYREQMIEVVAVDRPDIINAKLLEQRSADPKIAGEFLGLAGPVIDEFGQTAAELLCCFAHGPVGAAGYEARE